MVQSVERALGVLHALAEHEDGLGVLELARELGLPNSTTHRLLSVLKTRDYVVQDPVTGKYGIGLAVVTLARRKLKPMSLREVAAPFLTELRDRTGETAHLVVLEGRSAICIASVESLRDMRMCSPVGGLNPLTCTAVGKVLLAFAPREFQESVLAGARVAHTARTLVNQDALEVELDCVREEDIAFDREEYETGVQCTAVPVRDSAGKVIAAVGVSCPAVRMDTARWEGVARCVRECGERLSREYSARVEDG